MPRAARLIHAARTLLLAGIALASSGCSTHDEGTPPPPREAGRTVLIYMAAHNSLGAQGAADDDSLEVMAARTALSADDRLLLLIDKGARPTLYRVLPDALQPQRIATWEATNETTSPRFLQEVLTRTQQVCPAKEYGLVLWSHSDGWLPATETTPANKAQLPHTPAARPKSWGIDTGTLPAATDEGTQMDIAALAQAIEATGKKMRYIFFDSCLMQNIEAAYALRNATDLVIAAPMNIPAPGANYTHQIAQGLFSATPQDIVTTYVSDVCDPSQSYEYSDFGLVMSCLRTDRLEALAQALRDALPQSLATGHRSIDMTGALHYQAYTPVYYYRPHNYDARHALRQLLPAERFASVNQALEDCIVRREATPRFWIGPGYYTYQSVPLDDYSGVSLFVPQDLYTQQADHTPHGDLNRAFTRTAWYDAAGWAQTGW